jgi:hypothetical protein
MSNKGMKLPPRRAWNSPHEVADFLLNSKSIQTDLLKINMARKNARRYGNTEYQRILESGLQLYKVKKAALI